jgi:hypothetical protein
MRDCDTGVSREQSKHASVTGEPLHTELGVKIAIVMTEYDWSIEEVSAGVGTVPGSGVEALQGAPLPGT